MEGLSRPLLTCCSIAEPFSAWRRGAEIDLKKYTEYCKRHQHEVDAYVALDAIPGENGKMDHSQSMIEKSAKKSYDNLQLMKAEGLSPIPVFHQGERFEWLDRMLKDGETYIGISPYLRSHQNEIIEWMDKCYTRITDTSGKPYLKTHGFGVTASVLCRRYPFYSVDSTSWSVGGGYGRIITPVIIDGKPDYSQPPLSLRMTARARDQSDGFDGLSESEQEVIRQYAQLINVPMGELRNTFIGRWHYNMAYFQGMAATCDGRLFKNRLNSIFAAPPKGYKSYQPEPIKMYMATVLHTKHHNVFLNELGIRNRLISYAFLKDMEDNFLGEYIKTGLPPMKEPKPKKTSIKTLSTEVYRVRRANRALSQIARVDEG